MNYIKSILLLPLTVFLLCSGTVYGTDYFYTNSGWSPSNPNGSFTANNTYYIDKDLDLGNGTINVYGNAILVVNQKLKFKNAYFYYNSTVIISDGGKIEAKKSGGVIQNHGDFTINGELKIENAMFYNYSTGVITVKGPSPDGKWKMKNAGFDNHGTVNVEFGSDEVKFENTTVQLYASSNFNMDGEVKLKNAVVNNYGPIAGLGWFKLEGSNKSATNYGINMYSGSTVNGVSGPSFINDNNQIEIAGLLFASSNLVYVENPSDLNNLSCSDVVLVRSSINVNGDYTVGNLIVYPGIEMVINSNKSVTVCSKIVNEGIITVKNNGSLIQTSNTVNDGEGYYVVKRKGGNSANAYNVWSSPMQQSDIPTVFSDMNPCDIYGYDGNNQSFGYDYTPGYSTTCAGNSVTFNSWLLPSSDGIMDVGAGYWAPGNGNQEVVFEGQVNNGPVSVPVYQTSGGANGSWNLLGNPFPCAIDVLLLYNLANNSSLYDGTVYFWVDDNSGGTSYDASSDYAVTNGSTVVGANGVTPSTVIPTGQGFWIQVTQSGTFEFDNSVRISGNNHDLYKTTATEEVYVWLDVVNDSNNFNEMCVGYSNLATDNYDVRLDSYKADGGAAISLSSTLNGDKFCIQTVAQMHEFETKVFDVAISTMNEGQHTFSAPRFENVPDQLNVYLVDNVTNTKTDLKASDYSVYLASGDVDNRFQIVFEMGQDPVISSVENVVEDDMVNVYQSNENLVISTNGELVNEVDIYNVSGQLVFTKMGSNSFSIANLNKGFYIVRVTLNNGNVVAVKKVLN